MQVTLFMAVTANGYIAGPNDETDWIKNFEDLYGVIADYKVIAMGKRTYDECIKYEVFPYKGALNVVMTHDNDLLAKSSGQALFTDAFLADVIKMIESKGYNRLLIIGGGHINASFIKDNLIDYLWLDIHPLIMADGIRLFEGDFESVNLEPISVNQIHDQLLRVKYRVRK